MRSASLHKTNIVKGIDLFEGERDTRHETQEVLRRGNLLSRNPDP